MIVPEIVTEYFLVRHGWRRVPGGDAWVRPVVATSGTCAPHTTEEAVAWQVEHNDWLEAAASVRGDLL